MDSPVGDPGVEAAPFTQIDTEKFWANYLIAKQHNPFVRIAAFKAQTHLAFQRLPSTKISEHPLDKIKSASASSCVVRVGPP